MSNWVVDTPPATTHAFVGAPKEGASGAATTWGCRTIHLPVALEALLHEHAILLQPSRQIERAQSGQRILDTARKRNRLEAFPHVAGQDQAFGFGDQTQAFSIA